MAEQRADEVTKQVFDLYRKHGHEDYDIGDDVTQIEHAVQCGMLAEKESASVELMLGAFLHDVGHLCGYEAGKPHMCTEGVQLGIQNHGYVGKKFLKDLGVPDDITIYVQRHVSAKRYLTFKDPHYHDQLSDASKMTLVHQGGPMTPGEAENFEKEPQFKDILRMRTWDEKAKDRTVKIELLEKYENIFREFMKEHFKKSHGL